jgi:glycosyltransferase involved in cell wall biosynthesis
VALQPLDVVSLLLALAWIVVGAAILAAQRAVRTLSDVLRESAVPSSLPSLSVVITARDEAERIESTVRAVLRQHYPALECVVVDDRSTDGSGAILDRLAAEMAPAETGGGAAGGAAADGGAGRLRVVHVAAVPDGWLGKCNACRVGAERSHGEWILFMDGDVDLLKDDLLARVLAHAAANALDHVALIPDLRPMSPIQGALLWVFAQMYLVAALAFEMERDRPRGGGGIGAFNLVRRAAYDRIGGHAPLRLDLADDFKLGRLLKESGARQRIYGAYGLVRCPWHMGVMRVVKGLEKNLFGGFDFSLLQAGAFTLLALALAFGPAAAAVAGGLAAEHAGGTERVAGLPFVPLAAQIALLLAAALPQAPLLGVPAVVLAPLHPPGVLLLLIALWNSVVRTIARGGVLWRETFYPLRVLRRGIVRRGDGRRFRGRPLRAPGPPPRGSPLP